MLSRVVVPSVCFTPRGGVRIPLTTAPASLPCTPLFVAMRHLPPTGGSLCSLAAVSSAAIPVRVKLKIPRANAAAATTLDIPFRWDPRANQSPTRALVAVLRTAALFDSRTGQIKNALAHCSGSNHGRHSYRMGPATTTTAASGPMQGGVVGTAASKTQVPLKARADAGSRNPGH